MTAGKPRNGFTPNGFTPNGFTLVEMLVSLVLFGIIAVVTTALTMGATRSFATSEIALTGLDALDRTRSLMAADLGQAAERPSLGADGGPMQAFTLTPSGFVMVRRGVSGILPSVQKIAWGFDGTSLLRQSFPSIDGSAPGPATILLPQVRAVALRVADKSGWRSDWSPEKPEQLPRAVEMTITRMDGLSVTFKFLVAA